MTVRTIAVTEGTVASIGGLRVGVANVWERTYQLPDGRERTALTAQLMVDDGSEAIVGDGSIVTLGSTGWLVSAVRKVGRAPGEVTFAEIA